MQILDCTLRDGGNVAGKGFNEKITAMVVRGLLDCGIMAIELGHCSGMGSYEAERAPCTDLEYLKAVAPYVSRSELGMFIRAVNANEENAALAAGHGLKFLRVGANAGDGRGSEAAVKAVKAAGLKCRYSLMKAYVLSARELAEEAKFLEGCGLDEITIMDSAGTMLPQQVTEYVSALADAVSIPVAFHGHNNLGLSTGNALAAQRAGATVFDAGLLGMARSAGNCATELAVAAFQRQGMLTDIDLLGLLAFLDRELIPAMREYDYRPAVTPNDLVYGLAGCHSSFSKTLEAVAAERGVSLYELILRVSAVNQKSPSRELMEKTADAIRSAM